MPLKPYYTEVYQDYNLYGAVFIYLLFIYLYLFCFIACMQYNQNAESMPATGADILVNYIIDYSLLKFIEIGSWEYRWHGQRIS